MEEIAEWLESRGIQQWRAGRFRLAADYYAHSIQQQEVYLVFIDGQLAGAARLLSREPIVWPEVVDDEGLYVSNLAVRRLWAGQGLGLRMLEWAADRAATMEKSYVRLDCFADNAFLCRYYEQAGFTDRGEIEARFPEPVGTLRLRRYEKSVEID